MDRIRMLTMVLILLAGSAGAHAKNADDVPVIGVLRTISAAQHDPAMDEIRAELRARGYTPGVNIRMEQRFANRRVERLPQLADELVRMKVKAIVAVNEASLRAAMQATRTIPIVVIAYDHDPVASGLIDSMTRPGGNVTGIFSRQVELGGKRLELLKETVPGLSRVAVFHDPASHAMDELKAAGKQLGLQLWPVELNNSKDFERAMKFAAKNTQAAILLYSPMFFEHRIRLASLAAEVRLPTMTQAPELVVAGVLMSYAPNRTEVARRTAYFIDRLLRGAMPADLPVEESATFKLTLNLKTAKTLGLTIPQSILQRADEVIR
jgi:putative ABC transport system substrate-binding protein